MKRTRDAEGKKLDAHAKAVEDSKVALKELEALLNYHEALVAAMRETIRRKR